MRPERKADNLTTIQGDCHIICELSLPGILWVPRAYNGTDLPFNDSSSTVCGTEFGGRGLELLNFKIWEA